MSSDAQLVSVERAAGLEAYEAPREAVIETENPLLRIHALMRGRYLAAVVLAIVLGAGLATGGFLLGRRLYLSTGAIRVSPVRELPDKNGTSSALPNYESFLDTQMTLLQREDVRMAAMEALKQPITDAAIQHFVANLTVHKRGEIIFVDFVDEDPGVARLTVKALVTAYYGKQLEEDTKLVEEGMKLLNRKKTRLEGDLAEPQNSILTLTRKYSGADLDQLCFARRTSIDAVELELRDIDLALSAAAEPKAPSADQGAPAIEPKAPATDAPIVAMAPKAPATAPVAMRELTAEEVAVRDRRTSTLLQQRDQYEDELQARKRTLDFKHPLVQAAQTSLDDKNKELIERVKTFNEELRAKGSDGVNLQNLMSPDAEAQRIMLKRLVARRDKLKALLPGAQSELDDTVRDKLKMDVWKEEVRKLKADLDRFTAIIDQKTLEQQVPGVVSVFSDGDHPLQPFKDTRITFGAAGGLGGVMMGLGIVLLWGFSDRRFRNSDDARLSISGSQLLGILPALPETLDDSMQASLASYSVHHIRIMLQVWDRPKRRQTFAITSPVAGTGKTSLALALGASFAASGSRTLLLDCDVVGGGLTRRVNAFVKRKIGRILVENKLVTLKQLDRALELSNRDSKRLGETLVGMGYVEAEDLEAALRDQAEVGLGLVDALKGEDIMNCITTTDVENLWVLPLGMTDGRHVPMLSPAAAKALIAAAREHFDTILVDTGPAPASLEAGAVAAAVDGVVLTVSRGEQRPLAEQCVAYLESVGARVVGFVFNRASSQDVERHSGGRSSGWSSRASKASPRGRMALGSERVVATAGVRETTTSEK